MRYLLLIVSVIFILGCTTTNDLRRMTANERATEVCKRQDNLRGLTKQIQELQNSVNESKSALQRGYKIHEQCGRVEIKGDALLSCDKFGSGTYCNEIQPKSYETRCSEMPVAINPELEKENIKKWSESIDLLKEQIKEKFKDCYRFMYSLTAEEAYKYYIKRNFEGWPE